MKGFIILLALVASCAARHSDEALQNNDTPAISYEDFLKNRNTYDRQLSEEGVWVHWDTNRGNIPLYAVHAGHERKGPVYVMRADHIDGGIYRGKYIGKYVPMSKYAAIVYTDGREYSKTQFDLLLHTNFEWTNDNRPAILGPSNELICRFEWNNQYFTPGFVVQTGGDSTCRIPFEGGASSKYFQVLRKSCIYNKNSNKHHH